MDNSKKNSYRLILVGVVFFVVGFIFSDILNKGGAGQNFLMGGNNKETIDKKNEDKKINISITPKIKVSLKTRNQLFGNSVFVFDVSLDRTSWIAVYEDINGQPGNILGAGILDAGNVLTYEIELLRNTIGDAKYYIKIHPDNGDRIFNYKEDLPIDDVIYSFRTTSGKPN